MRTVFTPILIALAISGCNVSTDHPDNAVAATPDDYAAKVAALPAGQRDGVLFRAIRDAGRNCQQVVRSQSIEPISGSPAWAATCDDRGSWVVVLNPGGVATVTATSDASR